MHSYFTLFSRFVGGNLMFFSEVARSVSIFFSLEGLELVFRPVFKTGSGRITPSVAGSIPALSEFIRIYGAF